MERTIIPTCSLVFRNRSFTEQLKGYESVGHSLAWVYQLMIIGESRFRYFNDRWSVYNNNSGGLTKNINTVRFIDSNILVLRNLLKDEYYRNLKHHIYLSLAREMTNMFFLEDRVSGRKEKLRMLWRYFCYMQKHIYHRLRSLLKHH